MSGLRRPSFSKRTRPVLVHVCGNSCSEVSFCITVKELVMLQSDFRTYQEKQKAGKTLAIISAVVFVLVLGYTMAKLYQVF